MREILFRGKRENNDEWVEGFFVENHFSVSEYRECFIRDLEGTMYKVIPETVGQYTGVKDKSGKKKVFEFDICKAYIHIYKVGKKELTGAICFEEGTFKFKCKRYIFNIYDLSASIEVIGNVFDSPELFEGDKT